MFDVYVETVFVTGPVAGPVSERCFGCGSSNLCLLNGPGVAKWCVSCQKAREVETGVLLKLPSAALATVETGPATETAHSGK